MAKRAIVNERTRHHDNAPGDFYVVDECCVTCGIPTTEAPSLFSAVDTEESWHCYVQRQPRSQIEIDLMTLTMQCAELDCIRYAGTSRGIQTQLVEAGEGSQCDHLPEDLRLLQREVDARIRRERRPAGLLERLLHWWQG